MTTRFHLRWGFEQSPEGWTQPEIEQHFVSIGLPMHGASDSIVLLSVLHDDASVLTGPSSVAAVSANGRTREPLTLKEQFHTWVVFGRILRQQVSPDSLMFTVCSMVLQAMSAIGMQAHELDIPPSIDGPLKIGSRFEHEGTRYRVTGVHEDSGDLLVRREA